MSKTGRPDDAMSGDLRAAFDAARAHPPEAGADFLARVLADAEAAQDGFAQAAQAEPRAAGRAPHGLRAVFRALGGWPAVAGLTAATVTGLWIGVAPPEGLSTTAQMVLGADVTLAFEPDLGTDLFPGEEG